MNLKFLLGLATGIVATRYFLSSKGRRLTENVKSSASNVLNKAEDMLGQVSNTSRTDSRPDRFVINQY